MNFVYFPPRRVSVSAWRRVYVAAWERMPLPAHEKFPQKILMELFWEPFSAETFEELYFRSGNDAPKTANYRSNFLRDGITALSIPPFMKGLRARLIGGVY